jgi:hypothetical protein
MLLSAAIIFFDTVIFATLSIATLIITLTLRCSSASQPRRRHPPTSPPLRRRHFERRHCPSARRCTLRYAITRRCPSYAIIATRDYAPAMPTLRHYALFAMPLMPPSAISPLI